MKFKSLIFIVLAASMTCTDIYAENNRPIDIALWENGPLEKNDDEGKTYDENVRIYRPSIKVFLPEGKNTGRAVIMCPGGGYALLAYDHEGYAYADYFKHQGIALIVLKYRMPHGNHKVPMSDVCEAMRVVKSHAAEWKINPDDIGIMGFSAGLRRAVSFVPAHRFMQMEEAHRERTGESRSLCAVRLQTPRCAWVTGLARRPDKVLGPSSEAFYERTKDYFNQLGEKMAAFMRDYFGEEP